MSKKFQFPKPIRYHLRNLADLLFYASRQREGDWCRQSASPVTNGVYGHTCDLIGAVIRAEYGPTISNVWQEYLDIVAVVEEHLTPLAAVEKAVAEAMVAVS